MCKFQLVIDGENRGIVYPAKIEVYGAGPDMQTILELPYQSTRRLLMRENHIGKGPFILYQIDPDPFFIFIAILGAIGSFASIIAYIESEIERRTQEREG